MDVQEPLRRWLALVGPKAVWGGLGMVLGWLFGWFSGTSVLVRRFGFHEKQDDVWGFTAAFLYGSVSFEGTNQEQTIPLLGRGGESAILRDPLPFQTAQFWGETHFFGGGSPKKQRWTGAPLRPWDRG